jgi:hypothetical protein
VGGVKARSEGRDPKSEFNRKERKEPKGPSSFLDFMCPLPVLRRFAIGFPVSFPGFLLSSESNSRAPGTR